MRTKESRKAAEEIAVIEENISSIHPDNPIAQAMTQRYRELKKKLNSS